MPLDDKRFRPLEGALDWSEEVFDSCAELAELLEAHSYRFARTMPGAPHSYTLKRTWESEELFVEALRKMRAVERVEELFGGRWYRRFTANGYKYWTMGAGLDHILINRAIHDTGFDPYAAVADAYDLGIHRSRSEVERTQRIYDSVKIEPGADILDIGCGTGTLVDFRFTDIEPDRYIGIDPSRAMLGVFADKHPEFHRRLVRTSFEDYWPKPGRKFDLVAALFGAPSYLADPDSVSRKIGWLLKPGGAAVLMYYRGKPEDTELYRRLGMQPPAAYGERVNGEFWTVRDDIGADWLTLVGSRT
ncbi:MAG: class I SAM-dependent methyltransferase [Alphaproteobacteria bacterium]|nr:class I SAM-dependent methyltransferase [Alphaproteobacteria bacterium]